MADVDGKSESTGVNALSDAAERVLENLAELEPELVSAGIFDADGSPVAVSSSSPDWVAAANELVDSVLASSDSEALDSAHVATSEGEVFVVTEAGLLLVAVTGRFVLASLTAYDMRMALRDLAGSTGATDPAPAAKNGGGANA